MHQKSAKIKQNNPIHIFRPPRLGLIHFFKINNIHIKFFLSTFGDNSPTTPLFFFSLAPPFLAASLFSRHSPSLLSAQTIRCGRTVLLSNIGRVIFLAIARALPLGAVLDDFGRALTLYSGRHWSPLASGRHFSYLLILGDLGLASRVVNAFIECEPEANSARRSYLLHRLRERRQLVQRNDVVTGMAGTKMS